MWAYVFRRLWQMIPTMLGVVLLVFVLFNLFGGDPAYVLAGKISNPEQIENIRRQLGVDQPYYVQLGIFMKQIVTANFGASWSTNEQVSHILATRLGPSLTVLIPLPTIPTKPSASIASRSSRSFSSGRSGTRDKATNQIFRVICYVHNS